MRSGGGKKGHYEARRREGFAIAELPTRAIIVECEGRRRASETHGSDIGETGDTSSALEEKRRTEEVDESAEDGKVFAKGNDASELADRAAGKLHADDVGGGGGDCLVPRDGAERSMSAKATREGGEETSLLSAIRSLERSRPEAAPGKL